MTLAHPQKDAERFAVYHVGREGEVAGGMTQVVNGYLRWPFSGCDVHVIASRDGSTGARGVLVFLRALARVARMRDRGSSVVVVHLSQGGSFVREGLLLRLAHARGFGTIAHLHGSSFPAFARQRPRRVGRVLRSADRVFVLSAATRDAVAGFLPDERIALVPNAVPAGRIRAKQKRVVFGGSVSHRKGVDVLVAAWREAGAGGDWVLDIAGPTADPEVVPEHLPNAIFHGSLPHARLMELLETAEIAVLPSRDEAMPMFVLEALARGDCVVATRVGGVPAVLGDGAGILVDAGDVAALTAALADLMGSARRRAEVRTAGTARFEEQFSAAALYPHLAELWREVLPVRSDRP